MIISVDEYLNDATRLASKFASPRSVAILTGVKSIPTFVASGFFLKFRNSIFLFTASHVTRALVDRAYVGKINYAPIEGHAIRSISSRKDNFDVAYWRVDRALVDQVGATVIDESQILQAKYEDPFFCVCGFPTSKHKLGKAVHVGSKQITSYCYTFSAGAANVDYSQFQKSENAHIALRYGIGHDEKGEMVTPPKPEGMSGSPLWVAKDMHSSKRLSLGGLLIEYHAKMGKVIFCTKIDAILQFLRETA